MNLKKWRKRKKRLKKIKMEFQKKQEEKLIADWLNKYGTEQELIDFHCFNRKPEAMGKAKRKQKISYLGIIKNG
jgi:hypothetical protein